MDRIHEISDDDTNSSVIEGGALKTASCCAPKSSKTIKISDEDLEKLKSSGNTCCAPDCNCISKLQLQQLQQKLSSIEDSDEDDDDISYRKRDRDKGAEKHRDTKNSKKENGTNISNGSNNNSSIKKEQHSDLDSEYSTTSSSGVSGNLLTSPILSTSATAPRGTCCSSCCKESRVNGRACLCQVPLSQRRGSLGENGCVTCNCNGCHPSDTITEGSGGNGSDSKSSSNSSNGGSINSSINGDSNSGKSSNISSSSGSINDKSANGNNITDGLKNGCCRACMKAFSETGKACLCQVPSSVRVGVLPEGGCKICKCKGCHPEESGRKRGGSSKGVGGPSRSGIPRGGVYPDDPHNPGLLMPYPPYPYPPPPPPHYRGRLPETFAYPYDYPDPIHHPPFLIPARGAPPPPHHHHYMSHPPPPHHLWGDRDVDYPDRTRDRDYHDDRDARRDGRRGATDYRDHRDRDSRDHRDRDSREHRDALKEKDSYRSTKDRDPYGDDKKYDHRPDTYDRVGGGRDKFSTYSRYPDSSDDYYYDSKDNRKRERVDSKMDHWLSSRDEQLSPKRYRDQY
eukprot:gene494-622_t